jgi:hypothetical protein
MIVRSSITLIPPRRAVSRSLILCPPRFLPGLTLADFDSRNARSSDPSFEYSSSLATLVLRNAYFEQSWCQRERLARTTQKKL